MPCGLPTWDFTDFVGNNKPSVVIGQFTKESAKKFHVAKSFCMAVKELFAFIEEEPVVERIACGWIV